jgi:4-aminobutyrate aminotransferase/(S)-3-amino-2-methylpropionate transaminase
MAALGSCAAPATVDAQSGFPIVIRSASGSRVTDADGNRYIDLTGFFGVALAGHRNPAVVAALRTQAGRMLHGMGDVHPSAVTARFLRELCRRMPAPDYAAVPALNGSDAVDCALKFAAAATGRPLAVAFEGAYHGLASGALEVTHCATFRQPFAPLLAGRARFAPWPSADGSDLDAVLGRVRGLCRDGRVGALVVEPIQGRGGIRVPPPGFLPGLAAVADECGAVLVADEVYTGVGRTGTFLACSHEGVVPDVVCLGKALGGGVPISACLMRPRVARAVERAGCEAPHTSTFLGHPLGCAAGLAVLSEIDRRGLLAAASAVGGVIAAWAADWKARFPLVRDVRGRGAMVGVDLARPDGSPASDAAGAVLGRCLDLGVILLAEGPASNVLAFTPPLAVAGRDLDVAMSIVERALAEVAA